MGEEEPSFIIETADGDFEATRDNAILFRFLGNLSMYDHAFFVTDHEQGRGMYVFAISPAFERVADYMIENDYESHLNLRQVADCDSQAYDRMIAEDAAKDFAAGIPDDWI